MNGFHFKGTWIIGEKKSKYSKTLKFRIFFCWNIYFKLAVDSSHFLWLKVIKWIASILRALELLKKKKKANRWDSSSHCTCTDFQCRIVNPELWSLKKLTRYGSQELLSYSEGLWEVWVVVEDSLPYAVCTIRSFFSPPGSFFSGLTSGKFLMKSLDSFFCHAKAFKFN